MNLAIVLLVVALCATKASAQPQVFNSGSTGADGPLIYAANLGQVYFPPAGIAPRSSNIYHFTTINVGSGTTVRLSGWVINGPVYWLSQGDVTIAGALDLSGRSGHPPNNAPARAPSEPGAGGYSGGLGHLGNGQNATSGNGPSGGPGPGYRSDIPDSGAGGAFSGSSYLQPLIGGSGGAGGCRPITNGCGGGGAGGGAILIASTTKITISGTINAGGGVGGANQSGSGGGGAIRLVSNIIANSGNLFVCGGARAGVLSAGEGYGGVVRFEGFSLSGNISVGQCSGSLSNGSAYSSAPYNLALPVGGSPTLNVTRVNDIPINANPFSFPDITLSTGSPVPVIVSGSNIPPGTTGSLFIFSEGSPDQTIPFTLAGTLAATTATVNVQYPVGGSRGYAKVVWGQ